MKLHTKYEIHLIFKTIMILLDKSREWICKSTSKYIITPTTEKVFNTIAIVIATVNANL
jgi:hypothetical protein